MTESPFKKAEDELLAGFKIDVGISDISSDGAESLRARLLERSDELEALARAGGGGGAELAAALEELGDAWASDSLGDDERAVRMYWAAVTTGRGGDSDDHYRRLEKLAEQIHRLEDVSTSLSFLEELARYLTASEGWSYSLGLWHELLSRDSSHVEALFEVLKAQPADAEAASQVAHLLTDYGRYAPGSDALAMLESAAKMFFANGDLEDAVSLVEELGERPEYWELWKLAVQGYADLGDFQAAAKWEERRARALQDPLELALALRAAASYAEQAGDIERAAGLRLEASLKGPEALYETRGLPRGEATWGGVTRPPFNRSLLGLRREAPSSTSRPEREIIVTGHNPGSDEPRVTFAPESRYRIRLSVGPGAPFNLAQGDLAVGNVPAEGLRTTWSVSSEHVEISRSSRGRCVFENSYFNARFELLIPEVGPSEMVELVVQTPSAQLPATLTAVILVGADLYRTFEVDMTRGASVERDFVAADPRHLDLEPAHEWATPPLAITITVQNDGKASVTSEGGSVDYSGIYDWVAGAKSLGQLIELVRARLETFRDQHSQYLDDLDPAAMEHELQAGSWKPYNPEFVLRNAPKTPAAQGPLSSPELRALASAGYRLFHAAFPPATQLRAIIDGLPYGTRINIHWTKGNGDWLSHVPWALMTGEAPDPMGQAPVDTTAFFGFRFRINAKPFYAPPTAAGRSYALGAPDQAFGFHFLYWGARTQEDVAIKAEADWQRGIVSSWPNQKLFPSAPGAEKAEIIGMLDEPKPSPAALLYLYCQCQTDGGNDPELFFASGSDGRLTFDNLSVKALSDSPLVFANGCMTALASPFGVSQLELSFISRNARAFIGTEARVPARLASRFAWVFFQFLYRRADPAALGAGEALTQARWFLFSRFSNLGGLFYAQAGGYDLMLASDEEVVGLRRTKR